MEKRTYTYDEFSIEDAFEVADIVLTARIKNIGMSVPGGGGQSYYIGTTLEQLHIEKGNYSDQTMVLNCQVLSLKDGLPITKPEAGSSYRFYVFIQRDQNNELRAFKITDI